VPEEAPEGGLGWGTVKVAVTSVMSVSTITAPPQLVEVESKVLSPVLVRWFTAERRVDRPRAAAMEESGDAAATLAKMMAAAEAVNFILSVLM
jgi:hypothetical protein